ncbi:hypothetical protein V2I01_26910 [Micromonospora sp. BRA006-A]|nr:hypothetical protein [Micromonospora sp. BRA006-A]
MERRWQHRIVQLLVPGDPAAVAVEARAADPLSYGSSAVDGQTVATNAQASWVGDGWSTPRNYVEQTFVSCKDNPGGSPSPKKTYDRCYAGPILTLSLNGSSTSLIWDVNKKVWKLQSDNGSVVTRVTGSNNGSGTYNTEYWRVTEPDGTIYEFDATAFRAGPPTSRRPSPSTTARSTPRTRMTPATTARGSTRPSAPWLTGGTSTTSRTRTAMRWPTSTTRTSTTTGATRAQRTSPTSATAASPASTTAQRRRCLRHRAEPGRVQHRRPLPLRHLQAAQRIHEGQLACDVPYDLVCAKDTDCKSWSPSFFPRCGSPPSRPSSTT